MLRLTSGTAVEEDARAVEMGLKLLAVICRPGDPFGAPVAALRRIEAAAAPIGQTRDEGARSLTTVRSVNLKHYISWTTSSGR